FCCYRKAEGGRQTMAHFGLLAAATPVSQEQFAHLATVVAVCWWALCFAIIFLMQCGFLLLEAGSVRAKNAAHVAAKVLAHTAIPGTVFSERFKFKAYLLFAALYAGIVYPIFGFLIWGGLGGSPLLDPHGLVVQAMDRLFTPEIGSDLGKKLIAYGMGADATG